MNSPIKKIMIAVDLSEYTEATLDYGISIAKSLGATLLLVNVINSRDLMSVEKYLAMESPELYQKFIENTYASRRENLKSLLSAATAQGVKGETMVRTGVPYQGLLDVIKSESPDLLIMGTKGRGNLADTLVGSCAQRMYYRCPIPMLSIRPRKA